MSLLSKIVPRARSTSAAFDECPKKVSLRAFSSALLKEPAVRSSFTLFSHASRSPENISFLNDVERLEAQAPLVYSEQLAEAIIDNLKDNKAVLLKLIEHPTLIEDLVENTPSTQITMFDTLSEEIEKKLNAIFSSFVKGEKGSSKGEKKESNGKRKSFLGFLCVGSTDAVPTMEVTKDEMNMEEWIEKRQRHGEFYEFLMSSNKSHLLIDIRESLSLFKTLTTVDSFKSLAKGIYDKYLGADTAWLEVNLEAKVIERIASALEEDEIPWNLFAEAKEIIIEQMHTEHSKLYLSSGHFDELLKERPNMGKAVSSDFGDNQSSARAPAPTSMVSNQAGMYSASPPTINQSGMYSAATPTMSYQSTAPSMSNQPGTYSAVSPAYNQSEMYANQPGMYSTPATSYGYNATQHITGDPSFIPAGVQFVPATSTSTGFSNVGPAPVKTDQVQIQTEQKEETYASGW